MSDFEKMKEMYDDFGIGYTEGESNEGCFEYKTIFLHCTNTTFVFDKSTGNYKTLDTDF